MKDFCVTHYSKMIDEYDDSQMFMNLSLPNN